MQPYGILNPQSTERLYLADRTPEIAEESAAKVSELYDRYKEQDDFVGMDMARKFLQMGYTRAMRYAKHKGGRKYDSNHELLPETVNEEKIECAQVGPCLPDMLMHLGQCIMQTRRPISSGQSSTDCMQTCL